MEKRKIKILVAYHKPAVLCESSICQPIHVGRKLLKQNSKGSLKLKKQYDWMCKNMIGDDTGTNISELNGKYCEMSMHYWAWKNYSTLNSPDYIGFMHYRRFFIFDENLFKTDKMKLWLEGVPCYKIKNFSKEVIANISDENISNTLSDNPDICTIKPHDINLRFNNDLYMKEHYLSTIDGSKRIIWDCFENVLSDKFPEYMDIMHEFSYGHYMYCFNMFIMKKEIFYEYCNFVYGVLGEIDARIDSSRFNRQELRFLGYIAEYLTTIFIMKCEKENFNIKYLDTIFIENTDLYNARLSVKNSILLPILKNIFNTKKDKDHKIVTIFGLKLKLRIANTSHIVELLNAQNSKIQILENKISEIQERQILNKK